MEAQKIKNTILVPVDFSKCAHAAIRHACDIATIIEEKQNVTLLYVIEDRNIEEFITEENPYREDGSQESILIEGARSKLNEMIRQYNEEFDVPLDYLISGGKPYEEIANVAEKINAESITMGTKGAKGFAGIMGSNAAKVVQIAPCPVVVINEKARARQYKNIVLPLDLAKETRQKVKYAAQLAKYFNSTVHIVSAMEKDLFLEKRIKNNLQFVENYLKERSINYTSEVLTDVDDYAEATLEFAQKKDADLILIMTREEAGLRSIFIGSYAQRIVNKSQIPVMCIHPNQKFMESYQISSAGFGI